MPKSTKRFVITDSSLNEYGFRILTSGVDLTQFKKNPIMLWMHMRAWRGTKDEVLPLGTFTDIEVDGDKIIGTPVFDDNDEFAMSIYNKVESGILKMCSGGFKVTTWSDEAEHVLQGQQRASGIKSILKEVSICDLGANNNALTLYDTNDEVINLSQNTGLDFIPLINQKSNEMVELKDVAVELNINEHTPAAVMQAVQILKKDLSDSQAENLALKQAQTKTEMDAELKSAVEAGKITAAQIPSLEKLADGKLETLKELLTTMQPHQSINSQINNTDNLANIEGLKKLSWDELDAKGLLAELKDKDFDVFKQKYKDEFGTEWKEN